MNGRPYRPHGAIHPIDAPASHRTPAIYPMEELERADRWALRIPLWIALAAFVLFAAIVGGARLLERLPHVPHHERPLNP